MGGSPVIVLDACVLYPAAQRDLFMWLAAGGVVRAHWTNQMLDEWMRNVEREPRVHPLLFCAAKIAGTQPKMLYPMYRILNL